ncbi:MAG: glycosyltransferase family 2 protein [Thermoanaerobaculia bacterium]|jgi:glycosyltransferase involved in cell wall biosynthesis
MSERSGDFSREPGLEVSIVMPCLNEAATIAQCVRSALDSLAACGVSGEVVVADNGSSDGSQQLATDAGARLVHVEEKGYGNALAGGIRASAGRYIVMGDADLSYDFSHAPRFIEQLRRGNDLVMGNRFTGGVARGAMPWKNRYIGNPILSGIGRILFGSEIGDFHCGLRAFSREAFERMNLTTAGMEFASEMVIKATLLHMRIAEVATTLSPDGRGRPPHLRPWRDGWRHLRFMLLYSPNWLFLYPGMLLTLAGAAMMLWLLPGPRTLIGFGLDVHTLVFSGAAMIIGIQAIAFWALSKTFAQRANLLPPGDTSGQLPGHIPFEAGATAGLLIAFVGLALSIGAVVYWGERSFGEMNPVVLLRWVIPGATLLAIGLQLVLFSFFLGILRLDLKR